MTPRFQIRKRAVAQQLFVALAGGGQRNTRRVPAARRGRDSPRQTAWRYADGDATRLSAASPKLPSRIASSACVLTWAAFMVLHHSGARASTRECHRSGRWAREMTSTSARACGEPVAPRASLRVQAQPPRRVRLLRAPEHVVIASDASHRAARICCCAQRTLAWRYERHVGGARARCKSWRGCALGYDSALACGPGGAASIPLPERFGSPAGA